jgi:hypothetical protein
VSRPHGIPSSKRHQPQSTLHPRVRQPRRRDAPFAERKALRRREAEAKAAQRETARDTIEKIVRQYLKGAAKRTRASTAAETSRIFRMYVLPEWQGKRLSEIDKAAVRSLVADIATRAPVMANRVLTAVKALFNFAVEPGSP